ncbi:hypothetical protein [Amycolatopsis methanolica]|uniref:hypothetical protein n=1 Tax=Amycolatopsis methanolica TaxID=1814 RepID=UPI003432215B
MIEQSTRRATAAHSVSVDEVRVRYGVFLDVRVPVSAMAGVRARSEDHSGRRGFDLDGETFTVALSWQTNVVLELSRPVAFTRPLGRARRGAGDQVLRRPSAGRGCRDTPRHGASA